MQRAKYGYRLFVFSQIRVIEKYTAVFSLLSIQRFTLYSGGNPMLDFFHAAVSPFTLPFTLLLVLMLLYWLLVILGLADADGLPDFDMDEGSFFSSLTAMLNIGEVPFMMVISFLLLSCWCFSMLSSHYLNPAQSFLLGTGLFFINILLGFFATVWMSRLLLKIFGPMASEDKEDQQILYRPALVITSEVNHQFGQVQIRSKGAPITVNARTMEERRFLKGEKVLIFDEDKEKGIYFVDKYEE